VTVSDSMTPSGPSASIVVGVVLVGVLLCAVMLISHMAYSEPEVDGSSWNQSSVVLLEEDFEAYRVGLSASNWTLNWTVVSPGYGLGSIWIEESFTGENRFLRVTSSCGSRAVLRHNLSVESGNLTLSARVRVEEVRLCNSSMDEVALSIGLYTNSSRRIPLVELGRSTNQTVMPFNHWYTQGAWIPVEAQIDTESSSASISIWGTPLGEREIPETSISSIDSMYILIGGGAWYVGRVDDVAVHQHPVPEILYTAPILALLWTSRESGKRGDRCASPASA